ncbi:MAG TPA: hypothetical protein VF607_05685, partial [Verrucomicrobiae bacterium]
SLQLSNQGPVTQTWSVINTSRWLNITPAAGTLAGHGQQALVVTWSTSAGHLADGQYIDTLSLTNSQTRGAITGSYTLQISASWLFNGGFETGDFSGWTRGGNLDFTTVNNGGSYVWAGAYGVRAGPVGSLGTLTQSIATVPGRPYWVSLWFTRPRAGTANELQVSWNGSVLWDRTNQPAVAWTNLQFLVAATTTNTLLQLGFRDDTQYTGVDEIRVIPVAPFALAVGAAGHLGWYAPAGLPYQVQATTNLATTVWQNLGPSLLTNDPAMEWSDPVPGDPVKFYRVVLPAP